MILKILSYLGDPRDLCMVGGSQTTELSNVVRHRLSAQDGNG